MDNVIYVSLCAAVAGGFLVPERGDGLEFGVGVFFACMALGIIAVAMNRYLDGPKKEVEDDG